MSLTELLSVPVEAHRVVLEAASPGILRLRVASSRELEDRQSYVVERRRWPGVSAETRRTRNGGFSIHTSELHVEVGLRPFGFRVWDRQKRLRFETAPAATAGRYSDPEAGGSCLEWHDRGVTFSRRISARERCYGYGELGETLDRSGLRFEQWNIDDIHHTPRQNYYCQIPFGIQMERLQEPGAGSIVHGVLLDNPGRISWDLGCTRAGVASCRTHTGDLDLWLIFADALPDVIRSYTMLTGTMNRPPDWALGYHQCRWSYYPESRVRRLAQQFRRRKIPCDALYLDIHYMNRYRVFSWNEKRFPNPQKLCSDLRRDGFRVVAIVDPGVKVDVEDPVYRSFCSRDGYFCQRSASPSAAGDKEEKRRVRHGDAPDPERLLDRGKQVALAPLSSSDKFFTGTVWPGAVHFPDFTRPEVRRAWGEHQDRSLLSLGISGIWNDMNEPAVFDTESKTFPNDVVHHDNGRNSRHEEVHQVYGMNMARASFEGFRRTLPKERPFVISRSGWSGIQRYAIVWTGDNHSTWASMPLDIQLNLSMGLSGVPMVGCDVGGFLYDCTPELFERWLEWGIFQPFCRVHSALETIDQEPWMFGSEVEHAARNLIGLRMRLLPYFKTLFAEAAETGAPVNRPLIWHYPDDPNTWNMSDQFLLGRDILVAPVLTPSTPQRLIYFPAGAWYHMWTGQIVTGPARVVIDAPHGEPPVFLRGGAILPMHQNVRLHTGEPEPDTTLLQIYPAAEMRGQLVEDDGWSREYLKGKQCAIDFSGLQSEQEIRIRIGKPRGSYTGRRKHWLVQVQSNVEITSCYVNGQKTPFKRTKGNLVVKVADTRREAEISFRLPARAVTLQGAV